MKGKVTAQHEPSPNTDGKERSSMRLSRSLSTPETWGFGLTGYLLWLGTAPAMHAAIGPGAIFVWLPGAIVSILLNLQVKKMGDRSPDIAGGTPNYTTRLLQNYPGLARYAAIGYLLGWVSVPPVNAIVLTDLIKANLDPLGIQTPEMPLKITFTCLAFIVAFSGTRALGILHLFAVVPALGFLLAFCVQGTLWLAFSPDSPGFFPSTWAATTPLTVVEWAKWYFIAVYAVYACETASSFVADSRCPHRTLQCLAFATWLIPPVYLGGSWILMRLATSPGLGDNTFLNLVAAAEPFWGGWASVLVTFLLACCCLIGSATAVSNSPRILYQLAKDGYVSPVFAAVSRQGVLAPALLVTLLLSLLCLVWGDVARVVMVTGTSYLISMMALHLGLWLRRGDPEVLWPKLSLCFFAVESFVLVVGGLAWNWKDWAIGLLLPLAVLACDRAIRRLPLPPFHLAWWARLAENRAIAPVKDFVALQVGVLIALTCLATTAGWAIRAKFGGISSHANTHLLVVAIVNVAFLAVAIATWTTLPQVAAIADARQKAENLFLTALDTSVDGLLVLDDKGVICQANPAAEKLFGRRSHYLIGRRLVELLFGLAGEPQQWARRSEVAIAAFGGKLHAVELLLSENLNQSLQEYFAILHDITEKKQAEEQLRQTASQLQAIFDAFPDLYFLLDADSTILDCKTGNQATDFEIPSEFFPGKRMVDVLPPLVSRQFKAGLQRLRLAASGGEDNFQPPIQIEYSLVVGEGEKHYEARLLPLLEQQAIAIVRDITERKQAEAALQQSEMRSRQQAEKLQRALHDLKQTQAQLIQTEKMSSLGLLVAGIAHEINNPVNFIYGNLIYVSDYTNHLLDAIELYQQSYPQPTPEIQNFLEESDIDFISEDLPKILISMKIGADRIREIVLTLRNFSRLDEAAMKAVNIHEGLDSTLVILQSRLKANPGPSAIQVVKHYGNLPEVECYAGALNQVFMNILNNAIDALVHYNKQQGSKEIQKFSSTIAISTEVLNRDWVRIGIKDNGSGMTEAVLSRLFDPFFTTKPVGEGTGLGLSIAYQIVVEKHGGRLNCFSQPGQGAEFVIEIPIRQAARTGLKAS